MLGGWVGLSNYSEPDVHFRRLGIMRFGMVLSIVVENTPSLSGFTVDVLLSYEEPNRCPLKVSK